MFTEHSQAAQVPVSKLLKQLQSLHSLLPLKPLLHCQNWLKPSEARLGICSLSQQCTYSPPPASGDLLRSLSFTPRDPEEKRTNICWLRLIWMLWSPVSPPSPAEPFAEPFQSCHTPQDRFSCKVSMPL